MKKNQTMKNFGVIKLVELMLIYRMNNLTNALEI
jgi:hypothetical protein